MKGQGIKKHNSVSLMLYVGLKLWKWHWWWALNFRIP